MKKIPWNKGLKGYNKGHIVTEKAKIKIGNANRGRHHTEETKKKLRELNKGKHLSPETEFKKGSVSWSKLNPDKMPRSSNHHNWNNGSSFEPYSIEFNKQLKEMIRKRDNFICQLCGLKENGHKLAVHHTDYNKKNNNTNNLISLCKIPCNIKVNKNREYWKNYFWEIILCKKG